MAVGVDVGGAWNDAEDGVSIGDCHGLPFGGAKWDYQGVAFRESGGCK
jgi:hypothetical protein